MTNLERSEHISQLMAQGKLLEAFDTYYHNDVVKVEGDGTVVEGKAANRETQVQWMESVAGMHGGGDISRAEDPATGTVFLETWADIEFKNGTRHKMEQVEVQTWKDGLITRIRFYYNA
ncbi:MAG: SnoaL-like domain-containing protein [Bacteroidota bacterium]